MKTIFKIHLDAIYEFLQQKTEIGTEMAAEQWVLIGKHLTKYDLKHQFLFYITDYSKYGTLFPFIWDKLNERSRL